MNKITIFILSVIFVAPAIITASFASANTVQTLLPPSVAAVDCADVGQLCNIPANFAITVSNPAPITVNYIVSTKHCSSVKIHVLVDGVEKGASDFLGWGNGSMGPLSALINIPTISAGSHTIGLLAEGRVSGCNTGILGNWRGTVSITTAANAPSPVPDLSVSCSVSPSSINAGQSTVFTALASGGNGNYNYSWTGACSGTGSTCSNTFTSQGTKTATVVATSGLLTTSANCYVNVNQNCTQNYEQKCLGNNLYWYNSCGQQGSFIQACYNGCSNNSCQNTTCTYHAIQRCVGNDLYWYDSCGLQQDYIGNCNNYNNNYNYNYNNNYSNCTYHAYKLCHGNNIYWYDSCGNKQDLYYTCGGGQTCQYGQCKNYVQQVNNYVARNNIKCYGNSLYWYDSLGSINTIYKNCSDSNSCTLDSCSGNKCINTLKCDGTSCSTDSADYAKYCSAKPAVTEKCGNGTCETTDGETAENCPADCKSDTTGLLVSFFNRESPDKQWQKTSTVPSNGQIYFMISVQNTSTSQINDAIVSANIPIEVSSLGNVQIDGVTFMGDIVSGINIGQLPPSGAKTITFEGRTQLLSTDEIKQATASVAVYETTKSDSVSIDFNPEQATAAISGATDTTGILGFLKRWYLWIIGGIVLAFLFVIVFRRLSTES